MPGIHLFTSLFPGAYTVPEAIFMGRCGSGGGGGNRMGIVGIALMVIGFLMFLIFVPRWVWTSALGVVFISVGFLIWRFA